jgi:signal transduction histidine kinase
LRNLAFAVAAALLLSVAACGETPQYGTAAEAKAMLEKAMDALKADKAAALDAFNSGQSPYTDRDLYVFCANAFDGVTTAHPVNKGKLIKDFKDVKGFAFGEEIMNTATEGTISEITYMWPRPGSDEPVEKVSFFTKASDQICGVGYYK